MTKFGRLVDLEALQTLSGNRKLEELRQRKILKEIDQDKELKEWDARVREERQALLEVIERNTELLQSSSRLIEEKRQLNEQIRGRQTETDWQKCVDEAEIQRLQNLVETHSKQIKALKKEIHHLYSAPQET
ncbi:unnamed protein product [Tetraodon nigroviridis]|nr:unnamed protein product [Tetraodon nigroviridis]